MAGSSEILCKHESTDADSDLSAPNTSPAVCARTHILHVLASLYPLGMVPEMGSVDVKQPAGQYLLGRTKHTQWILDNEWITAQSRRCLPELCLGEIASFVQASD